MSESHSDLKFTPLHQAHLALNARMVPFAGYDMPVQYEGVLAEHKWTRSNAGVFDVSHMGQARLSGAGAVAALESLTPVDWEALRPGRQRYSLLLSEEGGILDDLMVSRPDDNGFFIVVNAACKDQDFALLSDAAAKAGAEFHILADRALLALQGPKARDVMARFCPEACALFFMDCGVFDLMGHEAIISRSGYTGEDGFEISVPAEAASGLWDALLQNPEVRPIGLGARDSLRLEAGMPLYGHDMDATLNPFEASLGFGTSKARLARGDVRGQLRLMSAPEKVRVGLRPLEGPPAREGSIIRDAQSTDIGRITSGGPSPSLGHSIAMGYVPVGLSATGTRLLVETRGRAFPAEVVAMPFITPGYHRKPKS